MNHTTTTAEERRAARHRLRTAINEIRLAGETIGNPTLGEYEKKSLEGMIAELVVIDEMVCPCTENQKKATVE